MFFSSKKIYKYALSLLIVVIMLFLIPSCGRNFSESTAQINADKKKIDNFIAEHSLSPQGELVPTESAPEGSIPLIDTARALNNIYIIHLQEGSGSFVSSEDRASILYKGYYLDNLQLFDSFTDPFKRYQVWVSGAIKGIQYGLTAMKTSEESPSGGLLKPGIAWLLIPPSAAWGSSGISTPNVPPNTCLVYRIEVYSVNDILAE